MTYRRLVGEVYQSLQEAMKMDKLEKALRDQIVNWEKRRAVAKHEQEARECNLVLEELRAVASAAGLGDSTPEQAVGETRGGVKRGLGDGVAKSKPPTT